MPKLKVGILVPSYDGKVVCNFVVSIAEIFRLNEVFGGNLELYLQFWMGEAIIEKARNNLFNDAFNDGMDEIVWIDSDQSFDPMAFFKILTHPVDVVGMPVRMKTDDERYNLRPEDPKLHEYDSKLGLLKVERLGTGFLRVTRKAMAALFYNSADYNDGEKTRKRAFEMRCVNGALFTEDITFCDKLRELGFETYVDMSYTAKHFGMKCWEGDYKQYFKENHFET